LSCPGQCVLRRWAFIVGKSIRKIYEEQIEDFSQRAFGNWAELNR
jgi:hypothetical protein